MSLTIAPEAPEALEIPHFEITDLSRQVEAKHHYAALGLTIPMVAVHFNDIGSLGRFDAIDHTFSTPLTEAEAHEFRALVARAFLYFGEVEVLPLASGEPSSGKPVPFWPAKGKLSAFNPDKEIRSCDQPYPVYPWHIDGNVEGGGSVVYGAHLTTQESEGAVYAKLAHLAKRQSAAGFTQFLPGLRSEARKGKVRKGDLHIHIRQAPARSRHPSLVPTAHEYVSGIDGRMFIQEGYGTAVDWAHVQPPA